MELSGHTFLVTGGATGIGFALVERLVKNGSNVIIVGRRESALLEAQNKLPQLQIHVADVSTAAEREALVEWASQTSPPVDVLVNNAGIQRNLKLADQEDWEITREEIAINLDAPIHLSRLIIPHLLQQKAPAIINVTSGLSFLPKADVPLYSATKAALHSFTLSLRHQLKDTPIKVLEIVPPAVDTDLGGPGLHTWGISVDVFADSVIEQIKEGKLETAFGFSAKASQASRGELDAMFAQMNGSS